MILDFDKSAAQVVPHFKGGAGEAQVRTAVQDGMGRILTLTLPDSTATASTTTARNRWCCWRCCRSCGKRDARRPAERRTPFFLRQDGKRNGQEMQFRA